MKKKNHLLACTALICLLPLNLAWAQQRPDAGQALQNLQNIPEPKSTTQLPSFETPVTTSGETGGAEIQIQNIVINGNTIFTDEQLLGVLDGTLEKRFSLSGLKGLANKITQFYHENDYPFARALIPAQSMKNGLLNIVIIEGQYGQVRVDGSDFRTNSAQKYLSSLPIGDLIKGDDLERASLILDDQPGYKFTPIIRPGQEVGTGDLSFQMSKDKQFGGNVGLDNQGNRYTGQIRSTAELYANSPFMFGDQINIKAIYTEESMWNGAVNYSLPLGYSGLRGNFGYTHTDYELGKEFSNLDAHGTADIASAGLSYPLVRSQKENLSIAVTYQHKWLTDEQGSTSAEDTKTSDVLPVTLNFDRRDGVLGGGITYGAFSWTNGILDLDSSLKATDQTTANADGHFYKINLDVARLQALPVQNLTLYARAYGQKSFNNLDSSEDFGLGGTNGVRAYPSGEAYGDEGALGQFELRYAVNDIISPYVFYDHGYSKTNQNPWTAGDNNRSIAGAGVGFRVNYKGWNVDATAAWRTVGGEPKSDSRDEMPMLRFSTGYSF